MILHALAIQIRAELRVRLSLNAASYRLTPLARYPCIDCLDAAVYIYIYQMTELSLCLCSQHALPLVDYTAPFTYINTIYI